MTEQGIGLLSPIGPRRLSLLKGNCQISKPKWRQEASFLPFSLLFFLFFSSVLLWRLCSPLCLWRVETVDERQRQHYPRFSVFFLLRLREAGFGVIQCRPFGSASCYHVQPPPHQKKKKDSHTILCFVNGCLWWPINTGRLGTGFIFTKVVPLHCNPPPPFLPHTFVQRQKIQCINSFYQHRRA